MINLINNNCVLLTALIIFLFASLCTSLKIKSEIDVTKFGLTQQEILKSPHYKDKVFNVPMSTESGEELLEHWAVQGFSGVVAAIATRRLTLVEEYQKKSHEKCSSEAETLAEHAKCLLLLEENAHKNRLIHRKRLFVRKMRRRIDKMESKTTMAPVTEEEIKKEKEWVGSFRFRAKREIKVHTRESYSLKGNKEMTPFGLVTKHLTSAVKLLKHTDKVSKWQDTIERIAKKADEIKEQKKMDDFMQRRLSIFTDAASKMKQNKKLAKDDSLKELNDLEEFIDNDQIKEVLRNKKNTMTEQEKMMMVPMKMIRDAAKLSLGMTGYNTTNFDRKIVRIISPRIMSVIPQEEEAKQNEIDVLSPSLFALHEDGSGVEKKASLGNLLGSLTDNKDSQDFLDFIVEATGVMIMSPWLMVPVIISPRLLSPVAVNPFLMVPIIISPLAFNPFILCPGSMNPFVLSPLVFAPFILSPQVLTPLILTPFCLGPIILNPLALSPLVLSPFVLSPTILSPQYVTAVVLSPYALSPAWGSDGAMVTVFASPSWLS